MGGYMGKDGQYFNGEKPTDAEREVLKAEMAEAKAIFEEVCYEELVGCGWTGPLPSIVEEGGPEVAPKAFFGGDKSEEQIAEHEAMRAVKACMMEGVDAGSTGDVCLAAMSDLEGLKQSHRGRGGKGGGKEGVMAGPFNGLSEEEIALKKEEYEAVKLEREALKAEVDGMKENLHSACAVEFALCGADSPYELTEEEKAGLSWEEKRAMKEDARAAKQCMQLVWESNDASDKCLDVKAELDAVMQDVKEILAEQGGRERGGKGRGGKGRGGKGGHRGSSMATVATATRGASSYGRSRRG
jgi:hypothetical protein